MDRDLIAREVESGEASTTSYGHEKELGVRERGLESEEGSSERIEKVYRFDSYDLLRLKSSQMLVESSI